MNADQLKQKAKELKEEKEISTVRFFNNEYIKPQNIDNYVRAIQQAKSYLTSIENGEIEGCGIEFSELGRATKGMFKGSLISYTSTCKKGNICPSCQQKINEAEKILREVLE